MNHQRLLWNLHCAATVVLREQLKFKSTVIRSKRSSCFFFSFWVERLILPLGHIVSWTSNHVTYDVYLPEVVETVTRTMLCILFSLLCVKYIFVWFYQSNGFEGNIMLNHVIVMFIHTLQRM